MSQNELCVNALMMCAITLILILIIKQYFGDYCIK